MQPSTTGRQLVVPLRKRAVWPRLRGSDTTIALPCSEWYVRRFSGSPRNLGADLEPQCRRDGHHVTDVEQAVEIQTSGATQRCPVLDSARELAIRDPQPCAITFAEDLLMS